MPQFNGRTDHDLLIEAITKLDRAISDIKDLDRNFLRSLDTKIDKESFDRTFKEFRKDLEEDISKIDKSVADGFTASTKISDDHETRLRRLERWGFTAIGALTIIQIGIALMK